MPLDNSNSACCKKKHPFHLNVTRWEQDTCFPIAIKRPSVYLWDTSSFDKMAETDDNTNDSIYR